MGKKEKLIYFLGYKGYKGSVEYSKEDNCFFGKVQDVSKDLILYEGETLEELKADFEGAVDDYTNQVSQAL